jgi:hypothetical protein
MISAGKALLFLVLLSFVPSAILFIVPFAKNLVHGRPVFQSPYGPFAGEELVLGPHFDVVQMLRRQKLSEYQISKRLESDGNSQRIVEGAWPIKPQQTTSAYLLSTNMEDKINNCQIVGRTHDRTESYAGGYVKNIQGVQLCVRF